MTIDHDDTSYEPPHATSPTDHVLNELQLPGYRLSLSEIKSAKI